MKRKRKRNKLRTFFGIICFLGFLFTLGTVGAMELETISLERGIAQAIIGLLLFAGAGYLGGFMQ